MTLTYGVAALGRPTFDVPFAEEKLSAAFAAFEAAGIKTVGPRDLLYDAEAAERAVAEMTEAGAIDALVILQITFTDATMTVKLAQEATAPVAIWAVPEPRIGGRLRLNAFCGLNLAAHALGKAGVAHRWLYADPERPNLAEDLRALAVPSVIKQSATTKSNAQVSEQSQKALDALNGATISVVGEHPAGFDTCAYDSAALKQLAGVEVNTIDLENLFDKAKSASAERAASVRAKAEENVSGLDGVDQTQLDRSFRLFCALEDIQKETNAKSLAVRCWPETFTEYGCAACGPMAMMNENKVPSACEADVYGSLSALLLQELSGDPVWMADLVDLDFDDNTGVFWHCGLAPLSMCDPEFNAEATIHTNRKMPLLHQFPLKPGEVTIARLSQSRNETKLVIGGAEFIRMPMAFTGTSGVVRFPLSTRAFCDKIMDEGLEHHFAIAYGDYRGQLREIAAALDIPVLELD